MIASEIAPGVVYRYCGFMSKAFATEGGALYLVVRMLEGPIPGAHEFMHLDGPYAGKIAQTPILLVESWIRHYEVVK